MVSSGLEEPPPTWKQETHLVIVCLAFVRFFFCFCLIGIRSGGASYFVVGRDPAGMKGSPEAVASPDDDLYDAEHGRYVLWMSPGVGSMKMLEFSQVCVCCVPVSCSCKEICKYKCIYVVMRQ